MFGLTTVPIKVHSATEDRSVHFHQVHEKDAARIKQRRICSKEGKEVPYKQVAKGYALAKGKYVMLSQDEIDAAGGERSHLIELDQFVRGEEIDPVYFARSYHLGAGEDAQDAYRLLHDALERSERVGIGRWVFHNREYLVAVRPLQQVLALHTMRFADELVDADELDLPTPSRGPDKREIEMAGKLVESLHERFKPEAFKDDYREAVLKLIEAKAKGKEVELPEAEEIEEAADLIGALEASLKRSRGGRTRKSPARASKSGAKGRSSRSGSTRDGAKSGSGQGRGQKKASS